MLGIVLVTMFGLQTAEANVNHRRHHHVKQHQRHHQSHKPVAVVNKRWVWVSGHWLRRPHSVVWVMGHWDLRPQPKHAHNYHCRH